MGRTTIVYKTQPRESKAAEPKPKREVRLELPNKKHHVRPGEGSEKASRYGETKRTSIRDRSPKSSSSRQPTVVGSSLATVARVLEKKEHSKVKALSKAHERHQPPSPVRIKSEHASPKDRSTKHSKSRRPSGVLVGKEEYAYATRRYTYMWWSH